MRDPKHTLLDMAAVIDIEGIHRGDQFAQHGDLTHLDICALAYTTAEWIGPTSIPGVFYTDDHASLQLIEASPGAMAAIRAISDAIGSAVDEEETPTGLYVPNYISHVSNWTRFGLPCAPQPPITSEVIGVILRAVNTLTQATGTRPGFTDAWGRCTTCGGHGTLTTDSEEIPYEELSPRRKQGYALGHRFVRFTSKPCPHCDGQDRATDTAVSAHEASL